MKNKCLLFISVIFLLSSCSITKRKYLPGFSIDRVGKSPKTIYPKELNSYRISTGNNITQPIAAKELSIPNTALSKDQENLHIPPIQHSVNHKTVISNTVACSSENLALYNPKDNPEHLSDTARTRLAGMVCKQAKASQHMGILGLTLTLFSLGLWAMVQVLINTGVPWATQMLAVTIVSTGVAVGGILAVLAIIFAIVAIHKIHQEKARYNGTSKAVSALIFAVLILAVIGYLGLAVYEK